MQRRTKLVFGAAVATVALAGGAGLAVAAGEDDSEGPDTPITGDALDQASVAALAFTGEGEVTDTEIDDEESKYEVEVTLDDGTQVDVQLDDNFDVVSSESDGAGDDADD